VKSPKRWRKAGQFDRALQVAQKIEDALVRSWALADIAEAMAKAGQTERANQAFQLALQVAQKLKDASDRSLALNRHHDGKSQTEGLMAPFKSPRN